jgi:hypothetical protein
MRKDLVQKLPFLLPSHTRLLFDQTHHEAKDINGCTTLATSHLRKSEQTTFVFLKYLAFGSLLVWFALHWIVAPLVCQTRLMPGL